MTCSISFAGCGFLMSYHVGVAMCLRQFAPDLVLGKICSTSSGLLVAVSLICDIPLGVITTEILRISNLARSFTLGPLDPRFNLQNSLEEVLRSHLPDDAHDRATGRLFISLTRIHDKSNVILSEFRYREQLIRAILAGCFVPTYSGLLPQPYKGVRYIDGSVTNNQPVIDQHTIRVSPFSGEADICPSTTAAQSNCTHANIVNMVVDVTEQNLSRFFRVFIPQDPVAMIRLCQQGFDDALGYLQCNKKTVLAKSVFITSTFLIIENGAEEHTTPSSSPMTSKSNKLSGNMEGQWETTTRKDRIEGEFNDIDSSVLSPNESILKTLNISGSHDGDGNKEGRTIRPVDLIVANLKSITGNSIETREFRMRLPKYDQDSKTDSGHVSAYFTRYLLRPVTEMLSEKICEASRVVLNKVNRRVNVEVLTDLLMKRPENPSTPEDINLLKHILQMTNEQTPFETIYYIDKSNKIHVTELFDISDCEDANLQTETERELNQMLEFDIDDWGDADFGYGEDDDDDLPDVDLFPAEGASSLVPSETDGKKPTTTRDDVQTQDCVEDEKDANAVDDDPYVFSNMTTKALNMSNEYNEMIFGTFRHMEEDDDFYDEDGVRDAIGRNITEVVDKVGHI